MTSVIRGAVVYLFLLLIFRLAGKRTLTEITTFDFAILLIISETTQQAMIGQDQSITNGLLLITTLVLLDVVLSLWKQRSAKFRQLVEDVPLILVENGRPLSDRLNKCRVDESDVMAAAREKHGLERMEQIKYAVLERGGGISIVPTADAK